MNPKLEKTILVGVLVTAAGLLLRHTETEQIRVERSECINNLRLIDAAKNQWALEQRKAETDTPPVFEVESSIWGGPPWTFDESKLPYCPEDPKQNFRSSYAMRTIAQKPICRMDKTHVEP